MARPSYRDRALVIRSYDFAEADRVLVLLTRHHGIVRAVAKGVRRSRSRFGSRLQRFVDLDIQLYPGRSLATITQADTVGFFGTGIIDDYERYTYACAGLEAAEKIADWLEPGDSYLFDATSELLTALPNSEYPTVALDGFILAALSRAGWEPSLFDCAACAAPGPHSSFHPAIGGAACQQCRPPQAADVDPATLHLMWLAAGGHWGAAASLAAQPTISAQAHQLTRSYAQYHLERAVTSLAVAERGL